MNYLDCAKCKVKIPLGKQSSPDVEKGDVLCFKCMMEYMKNMGMMPEYKKIFEDLKKVGLTRKPKSETDSNEQ
jgi:hypothetical protein